MPRSFVAILIGVGVVLTACAPAVEPAAPTAAPTPTAGPARKIGVAYSNLIADSLSLWVARESGIFAKNGLEVDLQYIASVNAFAALLAGQVQASSGGGSEVISGVSNGAEVIWIKTGSVPNVHAALMSGQVQGGLAQVPDTLKLEAAGLHPVIDMSVLNAPASGTVIAMQRAFINDNKDVPQKIVDSILQAYALEKQDKPMTIKVLKQYLKSEDDKAME